MRKKFRNVVLIIMMMIATQIYAQTSTGTGPVIPAPSGSSFYLWDNNKAMVPNQVALTSTADVTTVVPSPPIGGIVYNTIIAGTGSTAVTPGYYYWTGTRWDRFITGPLFQSVESTGSVIPNASWQIIPGTTLTANYLAGDVVTIHYSGNMAYSTGTGYATIDIAPFVNTSLISVGGYSRGEINSSVNAPWWIPYSSTAVYVIPTTGSYTFDLRTIRTGGSVGVIIGGNSTSATECVFTITTYRR